MAEFTATSSKDSSTGDAVVQESRVYTVEEVILERDAKGEVTKSIRVGGEPVELNEDQLKAARTYLNVREATDAEKEENNSGDDAVVADGKAPEPAPASSPAAAEAATQLARKRGGE